MLSSKSSRREPHDLSMTHMSSARFGLSDEWIPEPSLSGIGTPNLSNTPGRPNTAGHQSVQSAGDGTGNDPLHMTFLTAMLEEFSPSGGAGEEGPAITETTHAIAAAKLQRAVQRDIRKMLLRSKPYLQHTQAVAKVELASLVLLAKPKPALLHPENALGFDDHIEYAKWKTGQLAVQRGVDNYHKEVLVLKKADTQKKFQAYTDFKTQKKEKLKAEEHAEAAEKHRVGRLLDKHIERRGEEQLAEYQQRRKLELLQGRQRHETHTSDFN